MFFKYAILKYKKVPIINQQSNFQILRLFNLEVTLDGWKVSDMRLLDVYVPKFGHHFTKEEMRKNFELFCEARGWIVDL